MRRLEERSLSSILRSKLLTTFMNDDVPGKVNARGECFGQIDAMRICFASRSVEKGDWRNTLTRRFDSLSAKSCPVTARSEGAAGSERASERTARNQKILIMRGRGSVG